MERAIRFCRLYKREQLFPGALYCCENYPLSEKGTFRLHSDDLPSSKPLHLQAVHLWPKSLNTLFIFREFKKGTLFLLIRLSLT